MTDVAVSFESIVTHFEALPDPRHTRNRRHLLVDVLVIAVCGVIVGCTGPTSIERWAKAKEDWLRELLALPNGIPSRDCIRRVLSALQPEAFQKCFQGWIAACLVDNKKDSGATIAIDGKTMRRSHDREAGLGPLHLVSAWASEQGLALGQVATEEKSNEITAIPELLDQIDVKGAVVTIDAMGCQKEIAEKIVAGQGDYVLAVKDNQPKLHQAIQEVFRAHLEDDLQRVPHRRHETRETSHGRTDERYYYLAKVPRDFPLQEAWPSVKAIGMAVRITEKSDGTTSDDVRYFIVSRYLSGPRFAQAVRGHWGIENSLHWVLDVTFDEDQSRTRQRHMANNLSWLRRFAISLLKQHPSTHSIKGKREIAGWNNDFLMEVLAAQRT
jgi:predicted transposase YbfD/YdcC